MLIPFMNLGRIFQSHKQEFLTAINKMLDASTFVGGSEVSQFEKRFSEWVGGGISTLGCGNGTDALTLAAKALQLPKGSKAILPAMTFVATAEALLDAGLDIELVDITDDTYLMDPELIKKNLPQEVKLIAPVHLYGQMAEMDKIRELADSFQCYILEDAAQAHGALWKGKPVGYWGDIAAYSFYPGKNLGAFGDGGAVISRNSEWIKHCRALANHGTLTKFDHNIVGCNSRLDSVQAAVLNVKLNYIDKWTTARQKVAKTYYENLSNISGLQLPACHTDANHVYHIFMVLVENRDDLATYLKDRGIGTGIHYPRAIHQLKAFHDKFKGKSFPQSENVAAHGMSLPLCPMINPEEVQYVCNAVRSYFGKS